MEGFVPPHAAIRNSHPLEQPIPAPSKIYPRYLLHLPKSSHSGNRRKRAVNFIFICFRMQNVMESCTSDNEILSIGNILDFKPREENTKGKSMTGETYL